MSDCPYCGSAIDPGAPVCGSCGFPLAVDAGGEPGAASAAPGQAPSRPTATDDAPGRERTATGPPEPHAPDRKASWIPIVAALVVLGLLATMFLSRSDEGSSPTQPAPAGPDAARLNALAASAGCRPLQSPRVGTADHIAPPDTGDYPSSPPAGGVHYGRPDGPAPTGIHPDPVPNEAQVHNLEHGHVGIQYRDAGRDLVAALEDLARKDPAWIFVAPYPDMPHRVAFTSWGRLLACDQPTDAVVRVATEFVRLFRNEAPESIAGQPRSRPA